MKQVCVGYRVLYSREFGMNKIPYKMARCPCMQEKRAGGKPLELLARRKSETSPLSLLPSSPSSPGDKRFLRKANALFSLPQLPLGNQFLANSFFLSFTEDRWRTRSRLWNRPISVIYLQGTFKTMNSTNRRNIGILEKWREKYSLLSVFFYSNYSLNK